jgi:cell wall-associated NlpC family hydrolase
LIKWLYGQRGIWLPRRSIQQRALGQAVELHELREGDVVFTSGRINYYDTDPSCGVGHVGIATGEGTIVHAANSRVGIIETTVEDFISGEKLRGIRRYVPKDSEVVTVTTPPQREVETSDDIQWILLQTQAKNA